MKEMNIIMLVVDYIYVYIDNDGYDVFGVIVLMEENMIYYEFDEMELMGYLCLLVYYFGNVMVIVVVYKFIGDKSGLFYICWD